MQTFFVFDQSNQFKIMDIECPIMREIAFMGFDAAEEDLFEWKIRLFKDEKVVRSFDISDFNQMVQGLSIVRSMNLRAGRYDWIKDGDGSVQRFRDFINQSVLSE